MKKIKFTWRVDFDEEALFKPLKRKKPTTYFVNSMSDLFHENVPFEWIDKMFAVMG
jgi:protein gp37